jgi:hypothetical protein
LWGSGLYSSVQQSGVIYAGLTFQHKTTGITPAGFCFCAPANAAAFVTASTAGLAKYSMDGDKLRMDKQLHIPPHLGTVWSCGAAAELLALGPRQEGGPLQLLHVPSRTAIAPAGLPGAVTCAAVSADGTALMARDDQGNVALWPVVAAGSREGPPVLGLAQVQQQAQQAHAGGAADRTSSHITCCSLSADGLVAVSGSNNAAVAVWQRSSSHLQLALQLAAPAAVTCCSVSADGQRLAAGCSDGSVCCWSWHGGAATVVISPAAASSGTLSTVLPASSGELGQHQHQHQHGSPVTCCTVSADGRLMASGDSAGMVVIWDLALQQPEPAMAIQQHNSATTCCTFLPDGGQQQLLSCSATDMVVLRSYARVVRDGQGISYLHRPGTRSPVQEQQLAISTAASSSSGSGRVVGFCPLLDPGTGASCGEVMVVQRGGAASIASADGCHREFVWQLSEVEVFTLGSGYLTELRDIEASYLDMGPHRDDMEAPYIERRRQVGDRFEHLLCKQLSRASGGIKLCKFQHGSCSWGAEQHVAVAWDSGRVAVVSSTTGRQLGVGLRLVKFTCVTDLSLLGDTL